MALLYAIASNLDEFERYLRLDIPIVQYRDKGSLLPDGYNLPISKSQIIINDSLESAEKVGAWGVHLGQQDLLKYSKERLLARKVRLGISSHTLEEIKIALQYKPDYLGFGPVFETRLKVMTYPTHGLSGLKGIMQETTLPLCAIGGINRVNSNELKGSNVWALAVLSALKSMSDSEIVEWMAELSLASVRVIGPAI